MKYIALGIMIVFLPAAVFAQNVNSSSPQQAVETFTQLTNLDASTGISPDNLFYFLRRWKEGIELFLIFNDEGKVQQRLAFADVRMEEYGQLLDNNNIGRAQEILADYENTISRIQADLQTMQNAKRDIDVLSTTVSDRIVKHQEIMSRVYQKVPEGAKQQLKDAIDHIADKVPSFIELLSNPDVYSGAINRAKKVKTELQNTLTNEDFEGF